MVGPGQPGRQPLDEEATGWTIKKFVRTTRRYRTIEIRAAAHTITSTDQSYEASAYSYIASPTRLCVES